MPRRSTCAASNIPTSARPCTASTAARRRRWRRSGACRKRRRSTSTSACRSSAPRASSTSRTRSPISASWRQDKLHSPDTTYWPMFDGVRGGALREEFSYFANCALAGQKPGDRPAGRRDGGARSDARGRGIGAHRASRRRSADRSTLRVVRRERWQRSEFWWSGSATWGCARPRLHAHSRVRGGRRLHRGTSPSVKLPEALAGRRRFANFDDGAGRTEARHRLDQHAARHPRRLRDQGDGGGRACLRREAARRDRRERRARRRDRAGAPGGSSSSATSCASTRRGSSSSRSRAQLGTPLVFRMNLNQQSNGETWDGTSG